MPTNFAKPRRIRLMSGVERAEQYRLWDVKNPDGRAEIYRRYREKNKEACAARHAAWVEANRDRVRELERRRRVRGGRKRQDEVNAAHRRNRERARQALVDVSCETPCPGK